MIENKKGIDYTVSDIIAYDQDITDVTMSDYKDSFFPFVNIIVGRGKKFHWHHNPYIAANVYQTNHKVKGVQQAHNIKLSDCNREELVKLVNNTNLVDDLYLNSLCFDDKSKVKLSKDFRADTYENIII